MSDSESLESTATLLQRARLGEDGARDRLFSRYLPILRRWAHGRLPGYARGTIDTDDLVQITLLRSLDHLDSFEPRREGAFLAYLRRILINRLRDEIRAKARGPEDQPLDSLDEELQGSLPSAIEDAIGRQVVEQYEAALERLEERQREAIIARIEFGYSHEQVAEAIDAPSANAARMVVARALVRLAETLDA